MTESGLHTDLYQLTMAAGYYVRGPERGATFELYVRRLPQRRSFLVAAGLEQALSFLERIAFTAEDIRYLRSLPVFADVPRAFFDEFLPHFAFRGDVWAVAEGTPIFADEPILRVTAPLPEAQLVETALLAIVAFQTSVASKAARMVEAAAGRTVVEFGARRAHGLEAALLAARAAYLTGCDATSFVEAGRQYGLPVSGTMAHSWVLSFADEIEAFRQFAALFGRHAVLLLDTYDTLHAARRIPGSGLRPAAVRLDSGDLARLSHEVRRILDDAGLTETKIFASGDLDEDKIASLVGGDAPVDGFGVGAALTTSIDAPSLGAVYKLVEVEQSGDWTSVMKLSRDKQTRPGRKQIWRLYEGGLAVRDVVGLEIEPAPATGVPLLQRVMRGGKRSDPATPLAELRSRCRAAVAALPPEIRRLDATAAYPVELGPALRDLANRMAGDAVP